jgi:transcriptional regulator with XRE-family HTH domain
VGTLSKLRRLVLREGISVREAAQRLGIARNTATRWLALVDVTEPRYPKRVPAKSILEPFKEQMNSWLKVDLHRGKRDRKTTKEIFEGIRKLGYEGSCGPVYEYCKYWREEQKKAPRHAGFVPLSFELGEAFQFVETGNQSWRFRSSSAKVKGGKTSKNKITKGLEDAAGLTNLSTIS